MKLALEREIKDIDRQIKALEAHRSTKRRSLFDAQDVIDKRREQIIADVEGRLQQKSGASELFPIQWRLT